MSTEKQLDTTPAVSRRQVLKGGAALGLGLAGASMPAISRAADQKVTIWTWRTEDVPLWKSVQDELSKTIPGLTIDAQPSKATEYNAKVNTAMQGGQGPDIITTRAGAGYYKPFAEANMFVPLTADTIPGIKDLPQGTISQVSYKDQVYAVPFAKQVSFIYYNKDIFDKHQLKPPATYDEFLQTLETLKKNGEVPLFTPGREGWALSLYVDCIGATFLGDEWAGELLAGKHKFTDDKFVALLQRLVDLQPYFQDGYVGNNSDDLQQAFQTGRAATTLYGGWAFSEFMEGNPDLKFDFFLCPPDQAGGKVQSYVFLDGGYAVNAASKVKDTALEVLKFAATPQFGQIFQTATGDMSAIPGVEPPPDKPHFAHMSELASSKYAIDNLFRIRGPFNDGTPDLYSVLNSGLEGLWGNQITPEKLAQQIQDALDQWYPAFQK
jgi:raffinose/stachyose/melibiose transport system substrate-binding protein